MICIYIFIYTKLKRTQFFTIFCLSTSSIILNKRNTYNADKNGQTSWIILNNIYKNNKMLIRSQCDRMWSCWHTCKFIYKSEKSHLSMVLHYILLHMKIPTNYKFYLHNVFLFSFPWNQMHTVITIFYCLYIWLLSTQTFYSKDLSR